jgi:hypothetical protein
MIDLPDTSMLADRIIEAGLAAVTDEPRLAHVRAKLTERELQSLVSIITAATATIALRVVALGALGTKT